MNEEEEAALTENNAPDEAITADEISADTEAVETAVDAPSEDSILETVVVDPDQEEERGPEEPDTVDTTPIAKQIPTPVDEIEEDPAMNDNNAPEGFEELPATAVSPAPSAPAVSQRRGCVLLFLGAILGAFFGVTISLAILMGLNGTLTFTAADAQLRRAINEADIRQEDLESNLETRTAEMGFLKSTIEALNAEQEELTDGLVDIGAEMTEVEGQVTAVFTQVDTLDQRLETAETELESVADAAESFDTFLGGLRDLLLQVAPPTATPTPAAGRGTSTPAPAEGTQTGEKAGETAVPATRTPRPTSTPLPLTSTTPETDDAVTPTNTSIPTSIPSDTPVPTSTPAQQP